MNAAVQAIRILHLILIAGASLLRLAIGLSGQKFGRLITVLPPLHVHACPWVL